VTEPAQSLCSDEVYYVLTFYYFIQLLVRFYSPWFSIPQVLFCF